MKILFEILITLAAYMLFPFIYFYALDGKMTKGKIKLFNFINSIVVMIIFTGVYVYLEEDTLYSGAPALLYWFINNAIYTRYSVQDRIEVENKEKDKKLNTKSTSKSKSKELKMKERKDNKVIIISVCIVITIAIISGSILINTYIKLENKNKNEIDRQENLYACITDAKNNRNDLWNVNCKDPDGKCTISDQSTINWIEKRYEQDLDNCYQLYGS